MYKRDKVLQTKNVSKWVNTHQFIILHSTGNIWTKGNLNALLWKTSRPCSCFAFIDRDWKAYKLSEPTHITRHAGESFRGDFRLMNSYSLGIEVEGATDFTDPQFSRVIDLVQYLQKTFNIPKENILTHASITWRGSKSKKIWDWVTPSRKTDINRNFWADRWIPNFEEFRNIYFSWIVA